MYVVPQGFEKGQIMPIHLKSCEIEATSAFIKKTTLPFLRIVAC